MRRESVFNGIGERLALLITDEDSTVEILMVIAIGVLAFVMAFGLAFGALDLLLRAFGADKAGVCAAHSSSALGTATKLLPETD